MLEAKKETARPPITLRVEAEKISRFSVGTRWEVVASSVESLWGAQFTVTLKEIETAGDQE